LYEDTDGPRRVVGARALEMPARGLKSTEVDWDRCGAPGQWGGKMGSFRKGALADREWATKPGTGGGGDGFRLGRWAGTREAAYRRWGGPGTLGCRRAASWTVARALKMPARELKSTEVDWERGGIAGRRWGDRGDHKVCLLWVRTSVLFS
jgi:hypothetical protein